jgi:nicotinate-nucleotide pyrophosphorylase (carboxylating)
MAMSAGKREMDNLQRLLALAKAEDLGSGDVTGELLPADLRAEARFIARQELVFCGGMMLCAIAGAYDSAIATEVAVGDGASVAAGAALARWSGPARGVLAAERVALNFIQRLSGIATLTRRYVDAAAGAVSGAGAGAGVGSVAGVGAGVAILDTRKTTPGWRDLEKYAVRCGGGANHRRGLYDAILVKDNHLGALARGGSADPIGDLAGRLADARRRLGPDGFVEMEVDTLEQFEDALKLPLDVILLDNMTCEQMLRAVAIRDAAGLRARVKIEASGGITPANVAAIAACGVERISVGALTHSAPAADIGLDVELA